MTTKLTLSMEKSLIEKAKSLAHQSGRSLSDLVEGYLEALLAKEKDADLPSDLKKLRGTVKLPKNFNEKKEIRKMLGRKHGF